MGLLTSRQHPQNGEDDPAPAVQYKYPPKSGSFFGSHFLMGGERFEMVAPEAYLFGENSDLNFLGGKPVQFPYLHMQSMEPTRTLQCLVNIRRDSLKFVRVKQDEEEREGSVEGTENNPVAPVDSCKYNLEFTFDCDVPVAISILYFCTESAAADLGLRYTSKRPELTSSTYFYEAGANQTFSHPDHIFDPAQYKVEELKYDVDQEVIPVAILCLANPDSDGNDRQWHSTSAVVERSAEGVGFILKPLKQKLFVDGVAYLLQEIYGIENKNSNVSADGDVKEGPGDDLDDGGGDCVVCMSELRDTLILPCRHLCLCNACAETLRYKASNCPICRSPFRALLQIRTLRRLKSGASAGGESEDESPFSTGSGAFSPARYEAVPLIEALNGPMDHTQTCLTLPAHATARPRSPKAPPRHGKKKAPRQAAAIQEVLTPQSIQTRSSSSSDLKKESHKKKRTVDDLEMTVNPSGLRSREKAAEEGEERAEAGAVTQIVIEDEDDRTSGLGSSAPRESPRSSYSAASLGSTRPLLPSSDAMDSSVDDITDC